VVASDNFVSKKKKKKPSLQKIVVTVGWSRSLSSRCEDVSEKAESLPAYLPNFVRSNDDRLDR